MSFPVLIEGGYSNDKKTKARDEICNESQIGADRVGQQRCGHEPRWVGIDATTASASLRVPSPVSQIADSRASDDSGCSARMSTTWNSQLDNSQLMANFPPHTQGPACSTGMETQRSDFKCDSAMRVAPGETAGPVGCGCFGGMFKGLWKKVKRKKPNCEAAGDRERDAVTKGRELTAPTLHVGNIPNGDLSQSRLVIQGAGLDMAKKLPGSRRHHRKASMRHRCNMIEAYLSGDDWSRSQLSTIHRRCVSWDNSMEGSILVGMRLNGSAKSLHGNAVGSLGAPQLRSGVKSRSSGFSKGSDGIGVSLETRRRSNSVDHGSASESTIVATLPGGGDANNNMAKNGSALALDLQEGKHFLLRVSPILENEVKAM